MKIAIVHDWLVTYAGAERVLEQMLRCFPQADLFAVVDFISKEQRGFLLDKTSTTTLIQKIPFAKKKYRQLLPLMPWAIGRLDLSGYDLILSSSHAVAKGVKKRPGQVHLSYIHTPMRYAWDLREQYLFETGLNRGMKGRLAHWLLDRVQEWDLKNTTQVDGIIANSQYIADRILANYGREAEVIYPPVDVESFTLGTRKEDFYLTASRFVPYKKIDMIVEAFSKMPGKKLTVIGDGPDFAKVSALKSPNIELLGYQPAEVLKDYMQRAKAFVFAAEEDFGITVVEAQACGTPLIALGKGGALETIRGLEKESPTGVFFREQSPGSLTAAVMIFEAQQEKLTPENCRQNSIRFGADRFRKEYGGYVENFMNGRFSHHDAGPTPPP